MIERATDPVLVEVLGSPTRITTDNPEARVRLALCYERFPSCADEAKLEAKLRQDGSAFSIHVTSRDPVHAQDLVTGVRTLNHELLHAAMLQGRGYFYVHAGVVAVGDKAIVLPGISRAGKSTLVLALVEQGAQLLSDELLVFDPATSKIRAFPRALKVRDVCVPYFPSLKPFFLGDGEGRFVRFEAFRSDVVSEFATPALIALPTYDATRITALEPISSGEALLLVAASALNFGSHRTQSLHHLAALCETSTSFRLSWRNPHEAASLLLQHLNESRL